MKGIHTEIYNSRLLAPKLKKLKNKNVLGKKWPRPFLPRDPLKLPFFIMDSIKARTKLYRCQKRFF